VGHASDSFLLDNCLLGSMRGGGGENLDKKKKSAKNAMIQVDERGMSVGSCADVPTECDRAKRQQVKESDFTSVPRSGGCPKICNQKTTGTARGSTPQHQRMHKRDEKQNVQATCP